MHIKIERKLISRTMYYIGFNILVYACGDIFNLGIFLYMHVKTYFDIFFIY